MNQLATLSAAQIPTLISAAGDRAAYRFLEFFTAQIRTPHTRRAYVRAAGAFCAWLDNLSVWDGGCSKQSAEARITGLHRVAQSHGEATPLMRTPIQARPER